MHGVALDDDGIGREVHQQAHTHGKRIPTTASGSPRTRASLRNTSHVPVRRQSDLRDSSRSLGSSPRE